MVSSSGLAATTSKPVMMSAGVKTVSVRGGTNQILAGGGQTMMIGGKPVTVLTSGAAPVKTVQLVSGGGGQVMMAGRQQMMLVQGQSSNQTDHSSPVSGDSALAQLAEAGLLRARVERPGWRGHS